MKGMKKWISVASLAALACLSTHGDAQAAARAKYVFFFIGDGMASVQINAAEAYLANKVEHDDVGGSEKANLLKLSKLPVQGMCTTFPWNSYITDSAPAATALATGHKTADGVISMDSSKTTPYTTIAELAKSAGMKVGIISSVSIDHATPACFYAHQPNRNSYNDIANQLVPSSFDFFGGGGFLASNRADVLAAAETAGYAVADSRSEFDALASGQKAVAVNPILDGSKALYYDIDRSYDSANTNDHITLAQYTSKAIELLNNSNGFFLMVEGGKIDWACHANDARASIDDTIAFDDAVGVAIDFMKNHRSETLIVVTGDHETGGMTIGWAGTAYTSNFEKLEGQKLSYYEFDKIWNEYKTACGGGSCPEDIGDDLKTQINTLFGLNYAGLADYDKKRLEDAYDKSLGRASGKLAEEDSLLYGSYNPISVTLTHILNNRAGIGWTSYAHTGVPVPVLADGYGASTFNGFYDNTDVAKKIAKAMRVTLPE
jgi:alkaline phosphatase